MMGLVPRAAIGWSVWLAASAAGCVGPDAVIGLDERIHHDDFDYSVTQVERASIVGDLRAHGTFVIVTLRVDNRAVRVDHRWDNRVAYVLDAEGREFENDAAAQLELQRTQPFGYAQEYVTPAGKTEETRLVFDLPSTVASASLKVRGYLMMGDVFNGNRFRRTRIQLF